MTPDSYGQPITAIALFALLVLWVITSAREHEHRTGSLGRPAHIEWTSNRLGCIVACGCVVLAWIAIILLVTGWPH